MNVLALDTSMGVCSAAVLCTRDSSRTLFVREEAMPRGHAEALMPMVEEALNEAGLAPRDLGTVAATQGPGSFTGVRIAIAAARGLALVTGAPLYGTDSLTVMARAALRAGLDPAGAFAISVDARRDMLYLGLYDRDGARLEGPLLCAPADAVRHLPEGLGVAAGNGASLLAEAAAAHGRALEPALTNLQPGAVALAELASESADRLEILRPLYLRPPDAKPQRAALERRR